ncbi:MAG: tRNA threonylcarbamoyladenosine dehydratase, partial [Clostridiales bacterium]|nr:tRNA threonylcarbamoyladenosine dehydratase [Clostridiales bacterium]
LDINPVAEVKTFQTFYTGAENGIIDGCDYVIDAIDTVSSKITLVQEAQGKNIPIISSMGCGNKLDPFKFQIADIYNTSVCPLCRVMRYELRRRNVKNLKVLYSTEKPLHIIENTQEKPKSGKTQVPGSVSWVPSVAGLIIAGEVIKELTSFNSLEN